MIRIFLEDQRLELDGQNDYYNIKDGVATIYQKSKNKIVKVPLSRIKFIEEPYQKVEPSMVTG